MDTLKFEKLKTKVIAHRGLSGIECENTISAFVAAANRSYFGIEADVHETKDKKFVIFHDNSTKRLAKRDLEIKNTRLKKLKKLSLSNASGEKRSDLKVCTLDEYISVCKKYNKKAIIELKNRMSEKTISKIVKVFKKCDYLDNTVFISFSMDNLIDLRKLLPKQPIQFLTSKITDEILDQLVKYNFDLDIHYKCLNKEVIDKIHSKGILINCWTCDDLKIAEELALWGVDFITTNILE